MKISAALIVKNEESCLETCLKTLVGIDEIIVCDTGSEDKTVEIARRYTDKVYTDYKWEDSFAKARNHALSKCTGDWVLSIDADEILLEGGLDSIRKTIEESPNEFAFSVTMQAAVSGNKNLFPKVFKRCREVFWLGAAHNYISKCATKHSGATIVYGYSKAHKKDPDRTLRILQKEVDADPKKVRETYYLAREYYYRKQWLSAVYYYERYIKMSQWLPEKADAYLMLGRCYWELREGEKARDAVLQALKINPNFREACLAMSDMVWPKHKKNWVAMASAADNSEVLFIRAQAEGAPINRATVSKPGFPMDLAEAPRLFIENTLKEYRKVDVLEWGAGSSTRYFPELLQKEGIEYTWTAFEHNPKWAAEVKKTLLPNVTVTLADKDSKEYLEPGGKYDVIYVDGRNRVKCLQHAKKILKPDGVVILHDAERTKYEPGFEGYNYGLVLSSKAKLWYGHITSIPKTIHQIWIGPDKAPMGYINTWIEKNPNFKHVLWTEDKIVEFGLKNRKIYQAYCALRCFSGAANIARAEILERLGGVYVDADSKCITSIEDAPFMRGIFFTSLVVDRSDRVANSPIGAVPEHHILKEYVSKQGEIKELLPSFERSGPLLWTSLIKERSKALPPYMFLPVFHSGVKNKIKGTVYAEHDWYMSHKIMPDTTGK